MIDHLSNISLGQIDVFLCVVECESFTKAALELHMTQSAISKTIAKVERELDMKLFHRLYRGLEVTEEGRLLYSYWKPGLERLLDPYAQLYHEKSELDDTLQIGVTNTTDLNTYFWEIINEFQNEYETVHLTFNSDSIERLFSRISANQLDVIFVPDFMKYRAEDAALSWIWAAKDHVQVVLPKDHSLTRKQEKLSFEDIKDMVFVTLADSDYPENTRYIQELFSEAGYEWRGNKVSFQTPESIQDFYRETDGFMITDRYFKLKEAETNLVRKPLDQYYNGIICCWDPSRETQKTKTFLSFMKRRGL